MSSSRSTPSQRTDLFLFDDLRDVTRTSTLAQSDLTALRAVAEWIDSFVARPHKDLGRPGPVCPFVPEAAQYKRLWLAPQRVAGKSVTDIVQLIWSYQELFSDVAAAGGDHAGGTSIVIVFTDLSADLAKPLFAEVLGKLVVPSYGENGLVCGGFYENNEGTAIYNSNFRPFTAPVPFVLVRRAVIGDWKFFLSDEELLDLWASRYGVPAVRTLAEELRHLPWNSKRR